MHIETLLFRVIAIVLGIVLVVILIWLTLTRRSMRPKKGKQVQVITKTTQNGPSTSVFDNQPKKVVIATLIDKRSYSFFCQLVIKIRLFIDLKSDIII